jgi:hypothetical protein
VAPFFPPEQRDAILGFTPPPLPVKTAQTPLELTEAIPNTTGNAAAAAADPKELPHIPPAGLVGRVRAGLNWLALPGFILAANFCLIQLL